MLFMVRAALKVCIITFTTIAIAETKQDLETNLSSQLEIVRAMAPEDRAAAIAKLIMSLQPEDRQRGMNYINKIISNKDFSNEEINKPEAAAANSPPYKNFIKPNKDISGYYPNIAMPPRELYTWQVNFMKSKNSAGGISQKVYGGLGRRATSRSMRHWVRDPDTLSTAEHVSKILARYEEAKESLKVIRSHRVELRPRKGMKFGLFLEQGFDTTAHYINQETRITGLNEQNLRKVVHNAIEKYGLPTYVISPDQNSPVERGILTDCDSGEVIRKREPSQSKTYMQYTKCAYPGVSNHCYSQFKKNQELLLRSEVKYSQSDEARLRKELNSCLFKEARLVGNINHLEAVFEKIDFSQPATINWHCETHVPLIDQLSIPRCSYSLYISANRISMSFRDRLAASETNEAYVNRVRSISNNVEKLDTF